MAFLSVCGVVILIALFGSGPWTRDEVLATVGAAVGIPLWIILISFVMQFVIGPVRFRRQFRQQKTLHGKIDANWSEEAFVTSNQFGNSHMPWSAYLKWRDNGNTFLFFHSSRLFQFVPKRVLSIAQADDLKACAAAGVRRT